MRGILTILTIGIAAPLAFVGGTTWANAGASADAFGGREVTPRAPIAGDELALVETVQRVAPSVVFVDTVSEVTRRGMFNRPFTQRFEGSGSGIVWDTAGHVITNHHVVETATSISVTLATGESFPARLVGSAEDEDIAVLRIDAGDTPLTPVPLGASGDLRVGQRVLAIGSPFGLDQTLTVGHVSALGRTIQSRSGHTIYDVLQTDAAINPGNSGGALLDSAGRLIGVNTAIRSASRSSAGIGFAVPVDRVNKVVPLLIDGTMRRGPVLGITSVAPHIARQLGVDRGVLIAGLYEDLGADRAGLRGTRRNGRGEILLGDVIVGVESQRIDDMPDLRRVLGAYTPGETVAVTVERSGERVQLDVRLSDAPPL